MKTAILSQVAEDLARSLSFARVRGSSAFVTTALTYPNGSGIVLRIDESGSGYIVSDDGHSATIAETMDAAFIFRRLAAETAAKLGIDFSGGTFFLGEVTRERLVSAAVAVANAASRSMERTAHSVEQQRVRQSRDFFDLQLREAFGNEIDFDVTTVGATNREWEFDAGLRHGGHFTALFDLVSPSYFAVASANMKIMDVRSLSEEVTVTVALSDYQRTEPTLRAILSHAADKVIDANSDVAQYAALERVGWRPAPGRAH